MNKHVINSCVCYLCVLQLFVALSVSFSSCSKEFDVVERFQIERKLAGNRVKALDSVFTAFAVRNCGGNIVFAQKRDEYHLLVGDGALSKFHPLLRNGHGNSEWIAPMLTGESSIVDGKKYVNVLERSSNKLYAVDIADECSGRVLLANLNKSDLPGIRNVFCLADGGFIGVTDADLCQPFVLKSKSAKATLLDVGLDKKLLAADSQRLSQCLSTYNAKAHKLAMAYYAFPVLVIMSEDGIQTARLQIGEEMPDFTGTQDFEYPDYFLDICSTDNYIYALYQEPKSSNETNILVFRWSGEPIAKFTTPSMKSFTVDERKSIFVGLMENENEGVCAVFKFRM